MDHSRRLLNSECHAVFLNLPLRLPKLFPEITTAASRLSECLVPLFPQELLTTAVRGQLHFLISPRPICHLSLLPHLLHFEVANSQMSCWLPAFMGAGLRFTVTSFTGRDFLWLGPLPWGTAASQGRALYGGCWFFHSAWKAFCKETESCL